MQAALDAALERPHVDRDRAPAVDDHERRPDPRGRRRPHRRARHATTSCSPPAACTPSCTARSSATSRPPTCCWSAPPADRPRTCTCGRPFGRAQAQVGGDFRRPSGTCTAERPFGRRQVRVGQRRRSPGMSHPPRTVGTWLANAPSSRAPTAARTPSNGRGSARGAASGTRSSKRPSRCEGPSRPPSLSSRRCRSRRSTRRNGSPGRRASASSTGCWAAGSSPVRSRSSAASPGIGKSTLLLQAAASVARSGARVPLHVGRGVGRAGAGPRCTRRRARSTGCGSRPRATCSGIVASIDSVDPDVVVVDSIQTCTTPSSAPAPGSVNQVRDCAQQLVEATKRRRHRDGARRPRHQGGRARRPARARARRRHRALVRAATGTTRCGCCALLKHRFGSTDELGLFEMGEQGLVGVPDPSALFLADRRAGVPGSVVVADARRQPAAARRGAGARGVPRRRRCRAARRRASTRAGWRCSLAVLEQRVGVALAGPTSTSSWPAACASPSRAPTSRVALGDRVGADGGHASPRDLVALGEVGLGGEVRQVAQTPRRLAEARAARLRAGRRARSPRPASVERHLCWCARATLADALDLVGLSSTRRSSRPPLGDDVSVTELRSRRGTSSQPRPGRRPFAAGRAGHRRCARASTASCRRRWAR